MKKHITFALLFAAALTAQAQQGGISGEMLNQIKQSYKATPADKAIRNALGGTSINTLALNQENRADFDTEFSHKVLSKGITDQQSSGRCWLFTGLNVLRSQMIAKYGLDEMEFSQNYCFFYDQLEKANLFLQGIIDTSGKPMDDKMVEWLFKHPLSDGGQFTGVSDIIEKYGLVPKSAMVETFSSENTGKMSSLIGLKLKEFGLQLREAAATGAKPAELEKKKTEMLGTVKMNLLLNFNSTEYYQPGDTLPGKTNAGLMGAAEEKLVPQIEQMLPKMDSILYSLNKILADPALSATLHNAEKLTANLDVTTRQLNMLMQKDLPQLTGKLNTIADNFIAISDNLKGIDYASTFNKIDSTLYNVQMLTEKLNRKDNSIGLLFNDPTFYQNLSATTANAATLLEDLKAHPKRYVHFSLFGKKDK